MHELSPNAQKVQEFLYKQGFSYKVMELQQKTRSAAEAAQALGCALEQIAKSIVFQGNYTKKPILVIASGVNRVDESKLVSLVSEFVQKANPEFVRQHTGFPIGGVPPIHYINKIETLIDEDLLRYAEIWAAAGTPYAVFKLTPSDLVKMTYGRVVSIKST
jgi:prolyl-tRNA editing enzyme YbaK/EbsC (Cys-tRNA(Pro) deacylase)